MGLFVPSNYIIKNILSQITQTAILSYSEKLEKVKYSYKHLVFTLSNKLCNIAFDNPFRCNHTNYIFLFNSNFICRGLPSFTCISHNLK